MESEARRPTVVVADDHAEVHPLISRILRRECDVVGNVFDGQALLDAENRLHPDLLIVDVYMPVLDGVEAVRRLRARLSSVAVVFISTDAGEENAQRALSVGGTALVQKASAAEHLLPAALAALKERRALKGY